MYKVLHASPTHYLFIYSTHTMFDSKTTHIPHYWWRHPFFVPLYIGAGMLCVLVPTLAMHKTLVWACIAQHLLVELGGNLTMCH